MLDRPGRRFIFLLFGFLLAGAFAGAVSDAAEVPAGSISLTEARELALARNPDLRVALQEVIAVQGSSRQATAWPNPEITAEIENFGRDLPPWSDSEATLSLTQRVESFGRRWARAAAGRQERAVASWDLELVRRDLLAEVDRRFTTLLAAQERRKVLEENLAVSSELLAAVTALVEAGEASPIEAERVRADRIAIEMILEDAGLAAGRARRSLALLLDQPEAAFSRAEGSLRTEPILPSREELSVDSLDLPELKRWRATCARDQAARRAVQWSRFPDLSVSFGLRRFATTKEQTWVAAAGLALPLFDLSGGAVQEAKAREEQSLLRLQAEHGRIRAEREDAYDALAGAVRKVRGIEATLLPQTRSIFEAVGEGYRRGKFGLLDLLDARRSLAEANLRAVDSWEELGRARADLERNLGITLSLRTEETR